MNRNFVLDGMMGLMVGDALGIPVQFLGREEIAGRAQGKVTGMEGYGTFNLPPGSWSDDSSMSLATLDSIKIHKGIDLDDIMLRFINWCEEGAYTPYGFSYDKGSTCTKAIRNYSYSCNTNICGITGEYANGNGALMRILPVCLFNILKGIGDEEAIKNVHNVTALTHNHMRSKMCSGFYYFIAKRIIENAASTEAGNTGKSLVELVQEGVDDAHSYYKKDIRNYIELFRLIRIFNINEFMKLPVDSIKSSGYVIDSIEAAIWCLVTTDSYKECMLKAVNLGADTDTVAAIAGGIAGLYYGYEAIPGEWLDAIEKRDWIECFCNLEYSIDFPLTDIHIHAVYKVDDGSTSLEMSLEMIDNEYQQGVRTIVLTSHDWGSGRNHYNVRFDEIAKICAEKYPDLKILPGCEIYCDKSWMDRILQELETGIIRPMNNTKYVLVEFEKSGIDMDNILFCCKELFDKGYTPIIAHAERYYDVFDGINSVRELKNMGCLIQVNSYSLANETNKSAKSLARDIISARLADFLGSDAHRMNHRPPQVADGVEWLLREVEREYVEAIAYKNVEKYLSHM